MIFAAADSVSLLQDTYEHTAPSVRILSAFASDIPLIASSCFLGVKATDSTVQKPAEANLEQSAADIPNSFYLFKFRSRG